MKIVLNLLSLVGIILLSGCASSEPQTGGTSKQAWYQAGMSAEQTRRDLADCQYQALLYERRTSVQGDTVGQAVLLGMVASSADNNRQNQMIQSCMTAKGYSLVDRNSPLLKDSQPPQPTPQQKEADKKEYEEIKAKAETGDAKAQNSLGICYGTGKGVEKDYVEAVKWFRKAAEQNFANAQRNLGISYAQGKGVEKDDVEAVKWYRKAAEQGFANAQFNLGRCYEMGRGVAINSVDAARWYRKAANQGNAEGQYCLAFDYANGTGVLKDYVEGYKWLLLSAANGNKFAPNNIPEFEKQMSPEQIAEGQKLAREFEPLNSVTP